MKANRCWIHEDGQRFKKKKKRCQGMGGESKEDDQRAITKGKLNMMWSKTRAGLAISFYPHLFS